MGNLIFIKESDDFIDNR